ncbi:hypothetical protein CL614_09630 [archaeon]|nr:hypothetical protein [archaeon]|tara:strand:+ start:374 stop:568 length:195 start_codon:yes stop_codon:yes gene_type:complete
MKNILKYKLPMWVVVLWILINFWLWNIVVDKQYLECYNVENQLSEYKLAFPKFHSRFEGEKIDE